MPWVKRNDRTWDMYLNGKPCGYVVKVVFKDGTYTYQGIAFNKKTRKKSNPVSSTNKIKCMNAVYRDAMKLEAQFQ